MSDLERAVEAVVGPCLGVTAGEDVVIVVDRTTQAIGDALRDAAAALGAEPVMTVMEPRAVDGEEPPAAVAAALAAARVFIAPTRRSLSHTRARKAASDAGARGATLPGVTEDMLARLMACDFPTMAARSRAVAELLTTADSAHVTCPGGTDFTADLSGRTGIADDGDLSAEGAFGNLPCGEGFISPITGEGTVVATTLASLGLPDKPVRLTVRDGRLAEASDEWGARWTGLMDAAGPQGRNLAELGVGTNERATLTGNILEDEKMLGTVHVAFGASAGIGGTVAVPVHLDCLIADATLDIGGTRVLDGGRFVLAA
ncbi:MAG TPA: aminopeptidase [Solirubrobacteraceae bacterium]|nr:aminopeptidase [Solirubrobacteraceae bacterium]